MPIQIQNAFQFSAGRTCQQIIVDYTQTPYSSISRFMRTGPLHNNSIQGIITRVNHAYSIPSNNNISTIVNGLDYYPSHKSYIQQQNAHQHRVSKQKLHIAIQVLQTNQIRVSNFANFDILYDTVYKILKNGGVVQYHCLLVYDIALRLVYQQNQLSLLNTMQNVYLFRGAKRGAKFLLSRKLPYRLALSQLNHYFPGMSAVDIENILCVFF